ncbi:hypothetical protein JHK87_055736 [Glycine soja]|nr:hypothetical protein JHK87_055736 [Glycine soja]
MHKLVHRDDLEDVRREVYIMHLTPFFHIDRDEVRDREETIFISEKPFQNWIYEPKMSLKEKGANVQGNGQKPSLETFQLFSSLVSAFGIFDDVAQQVPHIPPPPCVEVLASEVPSYIKHNVDSVNLDGVTLLKGWVNTQQVFGLPNSNLVPGKYEGGLKLWEGSLDLIKALHSDIKNGLISFSGKSLTLKNIMMCLLCLLLGATAIHFEDFNAEAEVHFFAGDWSGIDKLLPHVSIDAKKNQGDGYEFIVMAETVYSINRLQNLYDLIKKCLQHPDGVVYMAAKKYYFGVGGGTQQFLSMVEKDGATQRLTTLKKNLEIVKSVGAIEKANSNRVKKYFRLEDVTSPHPGINK